MKLLSAQENLTPDALGHRLVHGGARFAGHVLTTPQIVEELDRIKGLAPLHNPPAVDLIKACQQRYPHLPQAVVFDTAYHSTIPDYAYTYALPRGLAKRLGIRKYGFHGTSHQYVAAEAAKMLGKPLDRLNAVSCHLGSGGASLCAIVNGRSVDNTMGFSPLQGLIMSTRCGDLDPAAALQLLSMSMGDEEAVEAVLNRRSGVLGLSGTSADIRDILAGASSNAASARVDLTRQTYLWRIRKYLGSYLVAAGQSGPVDAIIFTDTIGETLSEVRWNVCANLECFGVKIDSQRNNSVTQYPADVAADDSAVRILVILTNEELAIARETYRLLREKEGVAA
jgi:acetate kinase